MGNSLSTRRDKKTECAVRPRLDPLDALADRYAAADLLRVRVPVALGPGLPDAAHVDAHDGSIRPDGGAGDAPTSTNSFPADNDSDTESLRERRPSRSPMTFGSAGTRTFPYEHCSKQTVGGGIPRVTFWPSHLWRHVEYVPVHVLGQAATRSAPRMGGTDRDTSHDWSQPSESPLETALLSTEAGLISGASGNGHPHSPELAASAAIVHFSREEHMDLADLLSASSDLPEWRLRRVVEVHSAALGHLYATACRRAHDVFRLHTAYSAVRRPEPVGVLSMEIGTTGPVDLSGLGISMLSADVACFQGLTVLALCRNALESVPEEIGLLAGLRTLRLSENRISALPESVGRLSALKSLHVDRNRLVRLPRSIGGLSRLRTLNVAFNCLTSIPREAGALRRLHTLEAEHNALAWLPAELAAIESVRRIQLGGNPLVRERDVPAAEAAASSPPGPARLVEAAGRSMVVHDAPVPLADSGGVHARVPVSLQLDFACLERCAFCDGPLLRRRFLRIRHVWRHEQHVPFGYWLCEAHWSSERERCVALFAPQPLAQHGAQVESGAKRDKGAPRLWPAWLRRRRRGGAAGARDASADAAPCMPCGEWVRRTGAQRDPQPRMPQYDVVANGATLVLCDRSWAEALQSGEAALPDAV